MSEGSVRVSSRAPPVRSRAGSSAPSVSDSAGASVIAVQSGSSAVRAGEMRVVGRAPAPSGGTRCRPRAASQRCRAARPYRRLPDRAAGCATTRRRPPGGGSPAAAGPALRDRHRTTPPAASCRPRAQPSGRQSASSAIVVCRAASSRPATATRRRQCWPRPRHAAARAAASRRRWLCCDDLPAVAAFSAASRAAAAARRGGRARPAARAPRCSAVSPAGTVSSIAWLKRSIDAAALGQPMHDRRRRQLADGEVGRGAAVSIGHGALPPPPGSPRSDAGTRPAA